MAETAGRSDRVPSRMDNTASITPAETRRDVGSARAWLKRPDPSSMNIAKPRLVVAFDSNPWRR
jgi:hypothetical protein